MKTCREDGCESIDIAIRSAVCKMHHRELTRAHYQENKQAYLDKARKRNGEVLASHRLLVVEYLESHSCIDCGNSDTEVLEFDHRDPCSKVTEVGKLLTGSTRRLIDEINKCDVRCANCHRKRTRRQFGWWTKD